jgi:5'(3')-deoxyribonucleotidase
MVNRKLRVVIDIDGVACAHADAICKRINDDYGIHVSSDDVVSWDHDFGPITFIEAVEKYYPRDGFVLSMSPTIGFDVLLQNVEPFSTVTFATARIHAKQDTVEWIRKSFGQFYPVEFVKTKSSLKTDVVIDDSEKEVITAAARGLSAILLTQPWNDHASVDSLLSSQKSAWRARGFADVSRRLRIIYEEVLGGNEG